MKKFKEFFIFNKRIFVSFYVLTILYTSMVIRVISPSLCTDIRMFYFRYAYFGWAACIAVYDLLTQRIVKPAFKLVFLITFFTIASTLFLQPVPINIPQLFSLISFGICIYICTSVRSECNEDEFQGFIKIIGYQTILVVAVANLISFAGYLYYIKTGSVIPVNNVKWVWETPEGTTHFSFFLPKGVRYGGVYEAEPFAAFYNYIAILLTMYFREKKYLPALLCTVLTVLSATIILISDTRTIILILLLIVAYFLFSEAAKKVGRKKAERILFILLAAGILLAAIFIVPRLQQYSSLSADEQFAYLDNLSSARLKYYHAGIQAFQDHSLFGNGWINSDRLINDVTSKAVYVPSYHNLFINLLAWSGIMGTVVFTVMLVSCLIRIVKNTRNNTYSGTGWLKLLVLCVFCQSMLDVCIIGEDFHIETPYFWICLGYLVYQNCNQACSAGSSD